MVEQFVFDSLVYFAAIVCILALTGRGKRRYRATELSELSTADAAPLEGAEQGSVGSADVVEYVSSETFTEFTYEGWTVKELKAECKRMELTGYSKLRKNDLIQLLTVTREVANI